MKRKLFKINPKPLIKGHTYILALVFRDNSDQIWILNDLQPLTSLKFYVGIKAFNFVHIISALNSTIQHFKLNA